MNLDAARRRVHLDRVAESASDTGKGKKEPLPALLRRTGWPGQRSIIDDDGAAL
jgi:hypothetical protein